MKRWIKAGAMAVALVLGASAAHAGTEGQVDTSFGGTGWLRVLFDGDALSGGQGSVSLLTADNGILIGGRAYDSNKFVPVLARIKSDGTLDTAYGNLPTQPGRSRFDLNAHGFVGDFETAAIAAAPDGGVYLAGNARLPNATWGYASSGVIMRADRNGQLLTTYGSRGFVVPYHDVRIQRIAALPDGRLLMLQSLLPTEDGDLRIILRRLDDRGNYDVDFAEFSIGPGDLGGATQVLGADLKVGADGMYYVLATAAYADGTFYGTSKGVLFRTYPSGAFDASFAGGNGYAYFDFGPGQAAKTRMNNLAFQPNGMPVVLGSLWHTESPYLSSCGVARLHANGISDGAFGSGGQVVHTFGGYTSWCSNLLVQSGRRYLLHIDYQPGRPAVAALTQDSGALDASYGAAGYATPAHDYNVRSMHLDGLGRVVLSGIHQDGGIYAARLTGDILFGSGFEGD